jgi:ABC-type polysaccharide/polyol phosphate export permease
MTKYPALNDIAQSFKKFRLITYMAVSDLRARYKRSVLGPLWLTLSTVVGAAGLGFLWSELMKIDRASFVPSLTAGLIMWYFISGVIVESSTVFNRQANIIRNINLPLSIYPAQLIFRQLINLAHTAPVFLVVAFFLDFPLTSTALLAIPGVILLTLNLLWISLLIGLLGARFRDLEHLITSVMPLLMLISPVFYRPNFLPFSETIIWMNPFSHFIEIVRYPLLGSAPPMFVILANLGILIGGTLFTLWLFNRKHHRLTFWL